MHSGIYAAQANGYFRDEGLDLKIQEPSSTADSAKLLETGRADFAVMDISDFGIARERGLDLVAIAAIVQRPLASVIAGDRNEIRTPADLAGKTVGVTGVPSDDAVLDTVLRSGGVDPSDVHRVTIGFNAVADLAAGKIDAATAFWNAEGVQLQQTGNPDPRVPCGSVRRTSISRIARGDEIWKRGSSDPGWWRHSSAATGSLGAAPEPPFRTCSTRSRGSIPRIKRASCRLSPSLTPLPAGVPRRLRISTRARSIAGAIGRSKPACWTSRARARPAPAAP